MSIVRALYGGTHLVTTHLGMSLIIIFHNKIGILLKKNDRFNGTCDNTINIVGLSGFTGCLPELPGLYRDS